MATTGRDRIEAARQAVPKMSNEQVQKHLASGTPIVILDVREKEEWDEGHIPQATLLPRGRLEGRVEQVVPDRNALIVTHWAGEARAALAGQTLREMGYTNVCYLSGGFNDWKASELLVERPPTGWVTWRWWRPYWTWCLTNLPQSPSSIPDSIRRRGGYQQRQDPRLICCVRRGEHARLELAPEEAFGLVDPAAFQDVPRESIPNSALQVGYAGELPGPGGTLIPFKIHAIHDESVTLNLNHPLAGEHVIFEVWVRHIQD
jgi:rhodanese-related sulfurtransferase